MVNIFKKTISPVVAIALLIVVSVVAVVSFQGWFGTYSSGIYSSVEIQSQSSTEKAKIETVVGDQLYVKGEGNLSIKQVLIDGIECNISTNISGVGNISLSDCLNSATSKIPEVTIVTDSKVISKKVYLPSVQIDSNSQSESTSPVHTDTFISVWNTSKGGVSSNNQIALPLEADGDYDFYVTGNNLVGSPVHIQDYENNVLTFSSEGLQEINITGTIKGFRFNYGGDRLKISEIKAWGPLNVGNNGYYFYNCPYLKFTGNDSLDLTGTTNLCGMFLFATKFDGDLSNWDTSQVTTMEMMFCNANNFNGDISSWNVSNVKTMLSMFDSAYYFNQDISSWDVSSVTTMNNMFSYASYFNQDISSWDVSSVIQMNDMFSYTHYFNQDLSNWNVSNVNSMGYLFYNANSFNKDLSNWDVNQVTYCTRFAEGADAWELSNQIDFAGQGSTCTP